MNTGIAQSLFLVSLGTAESNGLQLFAQGSCQWDWAQCQRHRLKRTEVGLRGGERVSTKGGL